MARQLRQGRGENSVESAEGSRQSQVEFGRTLVRDMDGESREPPRPKISVRAWGGGNLGVRDSGKVGVSENGRRRVRRLAEGI